MTKSFKLNENICAEVLIDRKYEYLTSTKQRDNQNLHGMPIRFKTKWCVIFFLTIFICFLPESI